MLLDPLCWESSNPIFILICKNIFCSFFCKYMYLLTQQRCIWWIASETQSVVKTILKKLNEVVKTSTPSSAYLSVASPTGMNAKDWRASSASEMRVSPRGGCSNSGLTEWRPAQCSSLRRAAQLNNKALQLRSILNFNIFSTGSNNKKNLWSKRSEIHNRCSSEPCCLRAARWATFEFLRFVRKDLSFTLQHNKTTASTASRTVWRITKNFGEFPKNVAIFGWG